MYISVSTASSIALLFPALQLANAVPSVQQLQHVLAPAPQHITGSHVHNQNWEDLDIMDALEVMQEEYFDVWQGTWPSAIDWTAAVLGTHIPATLSTISSLNVTNSGQEGEPSEHMREDLVNRYFSQLIAFYYGQDWLGLRAQANDDMLWVVLGWLEAVTFVQEHSEMRHGDDKIPWYGHKFLPSFAHRARIFWELASLGWDETLCGGGMVWNPRLAPYKNAITNELYIAASISMYLYFPGDDNDAPFNSEQDHKFKAHHQKYLRAAIKAYDWLMESNMVNDQGLFVDGFHIDGWRGGRHPSNGTKKCDIRDEHVYTYNQGVILTGQRGLFLATGDRKYLDQGHRLISNVIAATGWDMESGKPEEDLVWKGLGRLGVLEEECDILGTCSQDGQTFKGIFFLHYSAFCSRLPENGTTFMVSQPINDMHTERCKSYASWVKHNARAASLTKDKDGLFGMWWTEGLFPNLDKAALEQARRYGPSHHLGTDYRNEGVPDDEIWRIQPGRNDDATHVARQEKWRQLDLADTHGVVQNPLHMLRTAEIQSGGISILKADLLHRMA